jgi:acetyl esterase/lipase
LSEVVIAQAVAVAGAVRPRRRLEDTAARLFIRGQPVGEQAVRRFWDDWLRRAQDWLGAAASPDADPDLEIAADRARAFIRMLSRPTARKMRRRLQGQAESVDSLLLSAVQNVLAILQTGEPLTDGGFRELLQASGSWPSSPTATGMWGPSVHLFLTTCWTHCATLA